tara:strand:- start:1268 stop:1489 length:222 start_codon:yes stop_codon:yes gene_type:complete
VELVVMLELGVTFTADITGGVFSTLTLYVSETVPPWVSVAVTVQVIVSDGEVVDVERLRFEPVPSVVVPLVHT